MNNAECSSKTVSDCFWLLHVSPNRPQDAKDTERIGEPYTVNGR